MFLKAQVRTCELSGHKKKKKKKKKKRIYRILLDIEVRGPDLWRQFQKNQNFRFYGPKGTDPDQ